MPADPDHEHRIIRLEAAVDLHAVQITEVSRDHAVTREALRIFEYTQTDQKKALDDLRIGIDGLRDDMSDHVISETKDRRHLLIGMATAVVTTVATFLAQFILR